MDSQELDAIIARYDAPDGRLLGILSEIQERERYIPKDALVLLSQKLDVSLSQLYGLVTFYSFFTLRPVGEHVITVCMGTACHVKGADAVLEALGRHLQIDTAAAQDGKFSVTTEDNRFTVSIARCFGACSMAPVLAVDGTLYEYATPENLPAILEGLGWSGHED